MVQVEQKRDSYRERFAAFESHHGEAPPWLHKLRQEAFASFERRGFPSTADESWRHTDLGPLADAAPNQLLPDCPGVPSELLAGFIAASSVFHRLVFVNGRICPGLSRLADLPPGVRLQSLGEALAQDGTLTRELLSRRTLGDAHSLVDLNTAFADEGAVLVVPRGVVLEAPVYVLHVGADAPSDYMTHPRHLLVLEEASQATVIESYVGLDQPATWTNAVTEVAVHPGAQLDYFKVVREGPETRSLHGLFVSQARDSRFHSFVLNCTGQLVRTEAVVDLEGEGAECQLQGLYLAHDTEHVDNHTVVHHRVPHGTSRQIYKGILDDRSTAAFDGRVVVHEGAQKTDAQQRNNNLLLSDSAVINTKPTLEIYADDVKCSHGATTGRLDADALFYLRSRGIGQADAEALLTYAFASELVQDIRLELLRIEIERYVATRIPDRRGLELHS